jgi:hypothetical protein
MHPNSLVIVKPGNAATHSKNYKAFDALVKKLERERARLQSWDDARASLSVLINAELPARRQALDRLRKALVLHLDASYADARFNAADRGRMRATLVGVAEDILAVDEDAELRAVWQRHRVVPRGTADADDLFGFDAAQSIMDAAAEREREARAAERFGQTPHAAQRPAQAQAAPRRAARRMRSTPRSRCAASTASWSAPCIPTANPTPRCARAIPICSSAPMPPMHSTICTRCCRCR